MGGSLQAALGLTAVAAAEGKLHPVIAPFLCGSSLVPLRKKDGGVRPIAVGDTIRRVIGKVLLGSSEVKKQVAGLRPRQCGVDVPYAAELVGMSLQRLVDHASQEPWVCLQVDVRNAFNTVDRSAKLAQCAKKVPAGCLGAMSSIARFSAKENCCCVHVPGCTRAMPWGRWGLPSGSTLTNASGYKNACGARGTWTMAQWWEVWM